MSHKVLLISLAVVVLTVAQTRSQPDANSRVASSAAELRFRRIQLLEERVALHQPFEGERPVRSLESLQAKIDLAETRFEYTNSKEEKVTQLRTVVSLYETIIDMVEHSFDDPAQFIGREWEAHHRSTRSKLLFLKSERLRVLIQLAAIES